MGGVGCGWLLAVVRFLQFGAHTSPPARILAGGGRMRTKKQKAEGKRAEGRTGKGKEKEKERKRKGKGKDAWSVAILAQE